MKMYEMSLSEKAELKYRDLVLQVNSVPKESISPELVRLTAKFTKAYSQFARRRSSRKFKKFSGFVSAATKLEKFITSIPLPVSGSGASCGDTSAVGQPGIIQNG